MEIKNFTPDSNPLFMHYDAVGETCIYLKSVIFPNDSSVASGIERMKRDMEKKSKKKKVKKNDEGCDDDQNDCVKCAPKYEMYTCKICLERNVNLIGIECHHTICSVCQFSTRTNKCSFCRQPTEFKPIFFL